MTKPLTKEENNFKIIINNKNMMSKEYSYSEKNVLSAKEFAIKKMINKISGIPTDIGLKGALNQTVFIIHKIMDEAFDIEGKLND